MNKEIAETTLRGLIGGIPYAGTLLNEVVFEHRSRIKQKRVEDFIKSFTEYLNNFSEFEINSENIKSEGFSDIFENLILKVSKNRSSKKIELYKKILKSEINSSSTQPDFVEIYLDLIDKLHEKQIEILKQYYLKINNSKQRRREINDARDKLLEHQQKIEDEKEKAKNGEANQLAFFQRKEGDYLQEVRDKESEFKNYNQYRMCEFYNLSSGDFSFFIQDLVSKSLLLDEMIGAIGHETNEIMDLTDFGRDFIIFITK